MLVLIKNVLQSATIDATTGVCQESSPRYLLSIIYMEQVVRMTHHSVGTNGFLETLHGLLLCVERCG